MLVAKNNKGRILVRQSILPLIFYSFFQVAYGQNELEISFDSIKSKIENKKSYTYYPKLLQRYHEFDTTLTIEDYALIYYGFSFQNDYLKNQPDETELKSTLESQNYEQVIIECQKILDQNPVSLYANNELGYALYKLNRPEDEWRKYQKRYQTLRKLIVHSGNGLSIETAFKVIYVSDEYNILYDYFEITKIHEQALVGFCDKFVVEPSEYFNATEVFFDVSRKLIRQQELIDK